ncbi:MAG: hypothetical protein V1859_08135 [archaeon]
MKRSLLALALSFIILSSIALGYSAIAKSNDVLDDSNLYLSLGDFLYGKKLMKPAIAAYEKGLLLDAGNARLLNNIGVAYVGVDDRLAEEYFLKAIGADSNYEAAMKNLAILYNKKQDYVKSVQLFKELNEMFPDDVSYMYNLALNTGNIYYYNSRSLDDLKIAISYYEKVDSIAPGFEKTTENLNVLRQIRELYN